MKSFTKIKNAERVWVGGKEAREILEQHWRKESTKNKDKPAVEWIWEEAMFGEEVDAEDERHLVEEITFEEVVYELKNKKSWTAPESDQVTYDLLKTAPESLLWLQVRWYSICFQWERMPACWKEGNTVFLPKQAILAQTPVERLRSVGFSQESQQLLITY